MALCLFCEIAAHRVPATVVFEDADLLAFLDIAPVRRGHVLIIPKRHVETFDQLEPALLARIAERGQRLARRMKQLYAVERVAFLFTGNDIAHTHAHVFPIVEKTDVTSARYIASAGEVAFSSAHLRIDGATLASVAAELGDP